MVKKKKSEVKREIQNPVGYPPGTVIEEFMDGNNNNHNSERFAPQDHNPLGCLAPLAPRAGG